MDSGRGKSHGIAGNLQSSPDLPLSDPPEYRAACSHRARRPGPAAQRTPAKRIFVAIRCAMAIAQRTFVCLFGPNSSEMPTQKQGLAYCSIVPGSNLQRRTSSKGVQFGLIRLSVRCDRVVNRVVRVFYQPRAPEPLPRLPQQMAS
jgi:hypothetical protein